jgi:hypothetical protein
MSRIWAGVSRPKSPWPCLSTRARLREPTPRLPTTLRHFDGPMPHLSRTALRVLAALGVTVSAVMLFLIWLAAPWGSRSGYAPTAVVSARDTPVPDPLPPLTEGLIRVTDARFRNGMWWVLDSRLSQVHRFSEAGEPLGSFGGRGQGPGEFVHASGLTFRADTIGILTGAGSMLHLFTAQGEEITREDVRLTSCASFQTWGIREAPNHGHLLRGVCLDVLPRPRAGGAIVHLPRSGPDALIWTDLEPLARGLNPFNFGVLAVDGERIWMTSTRTPCVTEWRWEQLESNMGPEFGRDEERCPTEWPGVRFAEIEERFFGGASRREGLQNFIRIPEWVPPLSAIFPFGEEVLLQRMTGIEGWDLVALHPSGATRLIRFGVPDGTYVEEGRFLLVWEGTQGIHLEFGLFPLP